MIFTKQIHRNVLHDLLMDSRKEMEVSFIKKDGTPRTVKGVIEPHKNHTGINNVAHLGKYVTITSDYNTKPTFSNCNLATISKVKIGWTTYEVYGEFNNIYL